jgi:outer membrane protein OmpA-like peptidoglycan-associated protein
MMTGLMLVFLLISLLVITVVEEMKEELELQKQQLETQKKKIDDVEKQKNRILLEYNNAKADILKDLKKAFEDKEIEWDMTIDDDLTIKFNNPDVLFEANKSIIKSEFKIILNNFIPKYLEIINSEKYKDKIKEVRIE